MAHYHTPLKEKNKLVAAIYESVAGLPAKTAKLSAGESTKTIFAISTGYMNNSGLTVQKLSQFYKISPSDIFIIHDDLDLPTGEYKIQFDRGPAGHNGIKSIIENLNTQQFNRIRIGIGKPQSHIPVEDYVLQPFSAEEKTIIDNITPKIFEEINEIINR